jgi:hypothetical protein
MTDAALLAVVEVPFEDRVRCAADGCGHSVYKRVHLVRQGGHTQVYGSDCFNRLFKGTKLAAAEPHYSSSAGRPLTSEERALLVRNTELLIERFERERRDADEQARQRRITAQVADVPMQAARRLPSASERSAAELQARSNLALRYPGVNLDLPGFRGLVWLEAERILREGAA